MLDCQADLLRDLNTRFAVPLMPLEEAPVPARGLNPIFELHSRRYVMVTQYAAAVPVGEFGPVQVSQAQEERLIGNALDLLLTGV